VSMLTSSLITLKCDKAKSPVKFLSAHEVIHSFSC
jgi:hypothetical protein